VGIDLTRRGIDAKAAKKAKGSPLRVGGPRGAPDT
jgi:hypothetical protein